MQSSHNYYDHEATDVRSVAARQQLQWSSSASLLTTLDSIAVVIEIDDADERSFYCASQAKGLKGYFIRQRKRQTK